MALLKIGKKNSGKGADKKATSVAKKATKPAKAKRGFHFGKKKVDSVSPDASIVERLRLSPAVPNAMIDTLSEYASNDVDLLVKQDGMNYTVLVVTEDSLESAFADLDEDESDEALGNLTSSLQHELIANVTTNADLEANQLVIIPTNETLEELSESPLMANVEYHMGKFPVDGDLQDEPVQYDDEVYTLNKLYALSEGQDDGDDLDDGTSSDGVSVDVDDDFNDDIPDYPEEDDDDADLFGDNEDVPTADASGDDDDDDLFGESDDTGTDDLGFGDYGDDFGDDDIDASDTDTKSIDDVPDMLDEESADEDASALAEIESKVVTGANLELVSDSARFNEAFVKPPLTLFEIDKSDDTSELQKTINGMKRSANTKLKALHTQQVQTLVQLYNSSSPRLATFVQDKYSYTNPESKFAQVKKTIEETHDNDLIDKEQDVADALAQTQTIYAAKRQKVLEPQFRLLEQQYDDDHRSELQLAQKAAEAEVIANVDSVYKKSLTELEARRQDAAKQAYAKMETGLIDQLQDKFVEMQKDLNDIYAETQDALDKFQQDNYIRETQRVEALRVRQEDMSEAERVRQDYASKLADMQTKLAEETRAHENDIKQLQLKVGNAEVEKENAVKRSQTQSDELIASMQKNLDVATRQNENLQKMLNGNVSFKTRPSRKGADATSASNGKSVTSKSKPGNMGRNIAVGVGATVILGGVGGAVYVTHQNSQAQIKKIASNYSGLQSKYATLSKSASSTASALKKEKANNNSTLSSDNSYDAKTTDKDKSNTIRVAKSSSYAKDQVVATVVDGKTTTAKVTAVDDKNKTVTVHEASTNQDYQFSNK